MFFNKLNQFIGPQTGRRTILGTFGLIFHSYRNYTVKQVLSVGQVKLFCLPYTYGSIQTDTCVVSGGLVVLNPGHV